MDMMNAAETFTEYIRGGIKKGMKKTLGMEVEHFVLEEGSLRSVPYSGESGIRNSVEKLMALYQGAEPIIGEDLLGFTTDNFNITLEPAAQIEISIIPGDNIGLIRDIYMDFYEKLSAILKLSGQQLYTVGCQPVSHVDELELIPKGRYRLMDEHFKKTGTGGRQMMRGTASTQISVDFTSEEDFRRKLQTAYYYTPMFKLVSDRVNVFQGEAVDTSLKRTDIWNRTDPARCGILPGVFKADYGFKDYAEYVCSVPLIFLPGENGEQYTDMATAPELFEGREITEKDIEHIFSMPFPDVRVKRYLEIRGADSMPVDGVLFYCALVKGLLYSEKVLDHVQMCIREKDLGEEDIRKTEESLTERGFEGEIYGIPAMIFLHETLEACREGLTQEERGFLDGWKSVSEGASP